jgi:hypothetical protein
MVSTFRSLCWLHFPSAVLILAVTSCVVHADPDQRLQKEEDKEPQTGIDLSKKLSMLNSATHSLITADLAAFRPGRPMEEIFNETKWRGYFYMAAEHEGKAVYAIIYKIQSDDPKIEGGIWVWAIFVDGKFIKFVRPPARLPNDNAKEIKESYEHVLIRAMDAAPISVDKLKQEVKSLSPQPKNADPGLTIAYLVLRAMGAAPGPEPRASEQEYLRNAALRDQFNAARLRIGMTRSEVEATLGTKPLRSGKTKAGEYEVYGSNESFDINPWLHFSNILVTYRNGKVVGVRNLEL